MVAASVSRITPPAKRRAVVGRRRSKATTGLGLGGRRGRGPLGARTVASALLALALLLPPVPLVHAHAPSTALFDALDADQDGVISREDWDISVDRIVQAIEMDVHDVENFEEDGHGGRNAEAARRDGLTGDWKVPKKALGGGADSAAGGGATAGGAADSAAAGAAEVGGQPAGAAFNPAAAGGPPPRRSSSKATPKKKLSFTKAFTASVAMILATEIGDKTFFIAAVLSMRNDRAAVFCGAILALIIMTVLSTMMGLVLPSILPRKYTHIIGGILFLYFGIKLVLDSRTMEDKVSDELEEVEEELLHTKSKKDEDEGSESGVTSASESDLEGGGAPPPPMSNGSAAVARKKPAKRSASGLAGATAYQSSSFQATFLQSLTLTFLAEWGDRSQIATIALAAAKDPLGVTIGGCIGHCMCTGLAVAGGRMLAAQISEKTVSFYGGCIFFVFGVHSMFFES